MKLAFDLCLSLCWCWAMTSIPDGYLLGLLGTAVGLACVVLVMD